MMPVTWEKSGPNLKPVFWCEDCGQPAHFGVGCNLRAAIAHKDASRAGRWYCGRVDGSPQCKQVQQEGRE